MYAEQPRTTNPARGLASAIGGGELTKVMSEIDSQVNNLAEGLARVESALGELSGRLTTILCMPPETEKPCSPREHCGSPLGQHLQAQADRAHLAADRIDYLMSCLRI